MKNIFTYVLLVIVIVGFSLPVNAEESQGADIFKSNRCAKCHSVAKEGIEKTKGGFGKAIGRNVRKDGKATPPDLSDVGKFRKVDFLKPWLKKKIRFKSPDGTVERKKHRKKFKGSDEDLQVLVDWLVTLKHEPVASE